jgi:hypothetical protein
MRAEGLTTGEAIIRVALAANAVVLAAIVMGLAGAVDTRRKLSLMAALLMSLFFPFVMDSDPRLMGLSFILALVAALALNPDRRRLQRLIGGVVLASSVGLFALMVSTEMAGHIRASEYSAKYQQYVRENPAAVSMSYCEQSRRWNGCEPC